jgi:hypothetical protein
MARTPGSFPARTTLAISARTRRISAALLAAALALLGLGLTAAPAIAASQNEIVIAPLFDGTAAFTAVDAANPADGGGVAPATHTPGPGQRGEQRCRAHL